MTGFGNMTFERFGRSHHFRIRTAADLARIGDLDEAHWVATGAPIAGLNCDGTFLALADSDANGRIMCFELIEAVRWLLGNLRDTGGLTTGSETLMLEMIDTSGAEGRRIRQSAERILRRLGAPESQEITLSQVRRLKQAVESAPVSEGGVVLPEASADGEVRRFLSDIIATVGGAPHPNGASGVGREQLDEFLAQARAYLDWRALAAGEGAAEVMPLGADTPDAFALYARLRGKIDEYFARCAAAAFDARLAEPAGTGDDQLQSLDMSDPQAVEEFLRRAPLAACRPDCLLALEEPVNPHYAADLSALAASVLARVLGSATTTLSSQQWGRVKDFFSPHEAWLAQKAAQPVEPLGEDVLRRYLDERFTKAAGSLIDEHRQTAVALDNIRLVEKLILYQAHLLALANNFVSFPHLYDPASRAMFEMGTLVMDGRRFNFAVRADDRAAHGAVAKSGNMFVLYVEVLPSGGRESFTVAVPVTAGSKGNLCVGKRGLFRDLQGRQSDARVVGIIENPISLAEAIFSPFQRLGRVLSGKIEEMTAAEEKKFDAAAAGTIDQVGKVPSVDRPAPPGRGLLAGGLLMGGGVALAALASAVAFVTKTLAGVAAYKILIGLGAAIVAVMLPTVVLAIVKLRRRDLSAILEGSAWAINASMRLTRRQGRSFTRRPALPKGAKGVRRTWLWLLAGALIAAAIAAIAAAIARG